MTKPGISPIDRVLNNLIRNPETFCWEWIKHLNGNGYGRIKVNHKNILVHRFIYQYIYGDIPEDKPWILHRCDNPKCCNPTHLYAGTPQNNTNDMMKRNRNYSRIGEKNGRVKLTEKQVMAIRTSDDIQMVLAKRFNVSQITISNIKTRKTWKHID